MVQAVERSHAQDLQLLWHRDHVFLPGVLAWRNETEQVLHALGFGLDKERIARLARESMAAEKAGGAILSERQQAEYHIAAAKRGLEARTTALQAHAQEQIRLVMAMEHLSDEEKKRLVDGILDMVSRSLL